MDEIAVRIEAEMNPTESEEKVKKAVESIFGKIPWKIETMGRASFLVSETQTREPLTRLWNILRRERIRAAARAVLLRGLDRRSLTFFLNKQVAYTGVVSFAGEASESPLGPIKVKIECEDPREIVDWLTSRTP